MPTPERTIVITGASSGFGAAAVRAFADRGDRVWGTMRDTAGRNAAKKAELEGYSPRIAIAEMDVTSDASVADGFAAILADGPIDILINNAGIMYIGMTEGYSVAQASEQMDTNYFGAIRAMQAVLPSMRAAGSGLIINTSSIAGRVSVPFFGTYCATKHALEAYSQSLRYEVSPFGVDIALVEPGPFPSNLLAAGKPPARADVLASYGDLGQVPDAMIAGFAQMLASDQAPDPQLVVYAYLSLADAAPGKRPTRTVVGITWGVDEMNAFTQPRQDALLKEMQLDTVLGGVDAWPHHNPPPEKGSNPMKKTLTSAAATALLATGALADDTASIKPIVGTFLGAVLQGDVDTMREVANADYIQHNPFIPTGLEPFIGLLPVLQEAGTTAENIRMFEDGNYVFMHNIWRNAAPFGADTMVSFDIIRVDENGKVAEHWDALQPLVTETASGRTQTDGPTEVTDLDKTEENKALAVALVEDVLMGKNPAKITEYISAENYAQHNPYIKDGLAGIVEAVEALTAQNNMFQYTEIHAVLGEGNFVLTISEGQWNGTTNAFYDLFRMEDGMIVEHWDVIQPVPTEGLANTNGMFTGFEGVGPDSIGQ